MDQTILEEIGLTASEARIYLVLLEQGASLAGTISRNTGIHRRSVYDAIERLIQKGLVSYIKKNNRKFFEAVSPERLIEILHKKEGDLKKVMPELKLLQQMCAEKNETLFFRGKAALKSAFDDQLEKAKTICIWGSSIKAAECLPFYFPHHDKIRIEKNIKAKLIFNESDRKEKHVKSIPLAEIRFVPENVKSDTAVIIYDKNVLVVAWKLNPIGILIRESVIAQGFQSYFDFMWSIAKK